MKALFQKENWIKGMLGVAAFVMIVSLETFTSLAASGKVVAATAKIRSEASTSSSVVGSTVKGKTIDIVGAVKDSSGTVWYKVPNGNNTYGYIRSDLVETSDDIKVETAAAATTTTTTAEKPADTVPTSIGEQAATIAVDSAKIRSGASTSHDPVASLSKGESVTLIGEATDSAGKKWYQIRFTKNGSSKEGYIRSDLITMGAAEGTADSDSTQTDGTDAAGADGSEETPADGENTDGAEAAETEETQEETPAEPEHNDYEVVYNDETYWLYDNVNGTMMSVTNLLDVVNQTSADNQSLQKQVTTEKIIIIVMAVVLVILIAVVTILIFKLKDASYYYEDYEDEEEEPMEEEMEPPVRKKKKQSREMDYEEEPAPVRKKRTREREDFYEEEERPVRKKARQEADLTAAEEKKPVKKTARKAQNFLVDDDEFEFEFLNMDDKDL